MIGTYPRLRCKWCHSVQRSVHECRCKPNKFLYAFQRRVMQTYHGSGVVVIQTKSIATTAKKFSGLNDWAEVDSRMTDICAPHQFNLKARKLCS